jgi:hypothetical protein
MVPAVALPPAVPFTSQVTLVSVGPVTVAEKCCVPPAVRVTVFGATEIVVGGGGGGGSGFTVTVALADFVGSALLRAVTIRASGLLVDGATYRPELEIIPAAVVPPCTPLTSHATLWSAAPVVLA